jgi:hypothetical protein
MYSIRFQYEMERVSVQYSIHVDIRGEKPNDSTLIKRKY